MKDYILKPGAFISKSTTDKTSDVPGLSLEKYIVQVLNGETCCLKNIVADSLTINGIEVGAGLKLKDDALMTTTLTSVVDRDNTASPLKLSTNLVSVGSTLQIATDNTTYIDAEDSLGNNRFTVSRTAGQQVVNVDFASNPTLNTKVGAIRTYQDGATLTDAISVERNGQTTFTERVKVEADSTATTQSTAVIQSSTTNAGIAIVPNGTGAITAQVPDGTVAGGNARGANAVDLQTNRGNQIQVASGISAVALGEFNEASGGYSTVTGGRSNQSTGSYSVISGGSSNDSTNDWSSVGGGRLNNATSAYSTISGGESNTASTNTHATVVGGQSNVSSGQYSVSGGISNVASGRGSVALGGNNNGNNATGTACVAMGEGNTSSGFNTSTFGENNNASGNNAFLCGSQGISTFQSFSFSSRNGTGFNNGKSQFCLYIQNNHSQQGGGNLSLLSGGTTNVGRLITNTDNTSANVNTQIIMQVIGITGTVNGISVGDSWGRNDQLVIRRLSGVYTIRGTVAKGTYNGDSSLLTADYDYSLSSGNIDMIFTAPTFTGGGEIQLRVVCKIELVETGF